MSSNPIDSPAAHRYVALTTYRRTGEAVTSPVWIAELGDGTVGITTEADSGKVKRLRNDDRVQLQPCDMRGRVPTSAPTWTGTATIVDGTEADRVRQAIAAKYRLMMTLFGWFDRLRGGGGDRVGLIVSVDE